MSSGEMLVAAFGTKDLYEVLGLEKKEASDATEIKKAYRIAALKHHPDKGGDAEKFKACSLAHSILSDEDKRKVYDETGDVDDAEEGSVDEKSFAEWDTYFRALYPKLTVAKIDAFAATYKGSEDEREDLLKYYSMYKGNFRSILSSVPLSEQHDVDRFCEIIDEAIALNEEVDSYPEYEKFKRSSSKVVNIDDDDDDDGAMEEEEGDEDEEEVDRSNDVDAMATSPSSSSTTKKGRKSPGKGEKIKASGSKSTKPKPGAKAKAKAPDAQVNNFLRALGGGKGKGKGKGKGEGSKSASFVEEYPSDSEMKNTSEPVGPSSSSSSSSSSSGSGKGRKKASAVSRGAMVQSVSGSVQTASALAKFDLDSHEDDAAMDIAASPTHDKTKTKAKAKAKAKARGGGAGDNDLAALIMANQSKRGGAGAADPLAAIAAKYVTKGKGSAKGKKRADLDYDDIDDAAFEATRSRIMK